MDAKTLDAIKRLDFGKNWWGDVTLQVMSAYQKYVKNEIEKVKAMNHSKVFNCKSISNFIN